jgi:arylsulfatase A-like enzyme
MDIFATACGAAGVAPPRNLDARSFLPILHGKQDSEGPRDFYFVRREGGAAYAGKTIEALRRGSWKLVQDSPFAPLELFNLENDPQETTDMSAANRKVFSELSGALRWHVQQAGTVPWQPPLVTTNTRGAKP